ncbi:MAG TPA: M24 family metallopeptidase [Pirellulaceae bacterium]|nr:M24 family metallopeptidase [Pirellulaceae bacterium]HMO92075.1 M24 family metallopeptidase [Pirellulaceae bacterium]HMP69337.1 M24 family metallopeptidase [Pirellulaceae bacterium]
MTSLINSSLKPSFNVEEVQQLIQESGFSGWLLYDFRGNNVLANRVLRIPPHQKASRRWFYFIPATGTPCKVVHRIEPRALDHLPGEKIVYLKWQELEAAIQNVVTGQDTIAMEYSPMNNNPYIAIVDAGTVELVRSFDVKVVSSGDLIQAFESRWDEHEWNLHLEADRFNQAAFELAWNMIAEAARKRRKLRETDVQQMVMDFYAENGMTTYSPPIVGVGPNSGDPHYSPLAGCDAEINVGDFVLLDMWAKMDKPGGVYSDLTKVGFVGDVVPEKYQQIFRIVADARDAGIACVRNGLASGNDVFGWQVDRATRDVIEKAGYGEYFIHRTGHNIGQETHGNGAHMDDLETREDRKVIPRTCFSIEPGIYLPEFGVRSEVNIFIDANSGVHVTGGLQTEVLAILAS